jgi:hypothetical protein
MESTCVDWVAVDERLEDRGMAVIVVNAATADRLAVTSQKSQIFELT